MFWLAFEARRGAKGQGTPRDDVEGVGGATGSVRVFLMTTDDTRIVCGVPMTLDLSCASCVLSVHVVAVTSIWGSKGRVAGA